MFSLRIKIPLSLQVLLSVAAGVITGVIFKTNPIIGTITVDDLGKLGLVVVRFLKTLAVPLIFFAVFDSMNKSNLNKKHGLGLIGISFLNVSVAMSIGLLLINFFRPGEYLTNHLSHLIQQFSSNASTTAPQKLDILTSLTNYIPENFLDPFLKGNVISVVFLALLLGLSMRFLKNSDKILPTVLHSATHAVELCYDIFLTLLMGVTKIIPLAAFGLISQVVGHSGIDVFYSLWIFLAVILAGFSIHSLLYYPFATYFLGKKPMFSLFKEGSDAILMGLTTNSSLATVPVTLGCLNKMKVSENASRLSACIGTNLNNDGIMLYEAMAALFLAQAFGLHLTFFDQLSVVGVAILCGVGIAGIPEAGLIILPLVLTAAGFPPALAAVAIPFVMPVDWIIARGRSALNVMNDMLIAIILDRFFKFKSSYNSQ